MRTIWALLLIMVSFGAVCADAETFEQYLNARPSADTPSNTDKMVVTQAGKVKLTSIDQITGRNINPLDIISKGPIPDIRAYMTQLQLAAWTVDKTTDVTSAFVAAIATVPTGGGGIFGLTNDIYTISPITISGKKIIIKPLGGAPSTTGSQGIFTGMPIIKLTPGATGDAFTITGTNSMLELHSIGLNGNAAFQTYSSHGIHTTNGGTAVVDHSTVWNFKADGVHADPNTPNLLITNRSYIVSNGRYGVYLYKLYDAVVEGSYLGDNGPNAANIWLDGDSSQSIEHIRIRGNDIYWSADHPGATGNNVYIGPWHRSTYLTDNDYYRAPQYGVYVMETTVPNAYVDIIGGRFQKNSSANTGIYSDVYAGHTGVNLFGTTHQYPGSGTKPKYLVEISNSISSGAISVQGLMYDSSAYVTGAVNYRTHAHWITRGSNYFARDAYLQFNQSTTGTSMLESYGSGGGTQYTLQANGKMLWGDGTAVPDTFIGRSGVGVLGFTSTSPQLDQNGTFQSVSPNATVTHLWGDDGGRLRYKAGSAPSSHSTSGINLAISGYNALGTTSGTQNLSIAYSVLTATLSGNTTFNASGGVAGDRLTVVITTSGTTSYTVTFGTNFLSSGTLATGTVALKKYSISFVCTDGTNWVETGRTAAM
jgi:hypothetical protein